MSPLLFSTLPLATCIPCPLRVGSHPGLLSVPFYFPFPLHARFHIRPGTRPPMSKKEEFERSEREACLPVVQLPRNRQNLVGKKKGGTPKSFPPNASLRSYTPPFPLRKSAFPVRQVQAFFGAARQIITKLNTPSEAQKRSFNTRKRSFS